MQVAENLKQQGCTREAASELLRAVLDKGGQPLSAHRWCTLLRLSLGPSGRGGRHSHQDQHTRENSVSDEEGEWVVRGGSSKALMAWHHVPVVARPKPAPKRLLKRRSQLKSCLRVRGAPRHTRTVSWAETGHETKTGLLRAERVYLLLEAPITHSCPTTSPIDQLVLPFSFSLSLSHSLSLSLSPLSLSLPGLGSMECRGTRSSAGPSTTPLEH